MAKGKEMTTTKTTAVEVPEFLRNAGPARGNEEVGADDLVMPRVEVVQALSPCRKRQDPSYIDGAEEGLLYNNLTRELYGNEIVVCPVAFKKEYILWKDRQKGGGFKGSFPTLAEAQLAHRAMEDAADIEITDTATHFVLVVHEDGRVEDAVISMAKSKMKVSRRWNSLIRLNGGDRFSRLYKLRAVEENGDKGDYYNLDVSNIGFVNVDIYRRAEKIYELVQAGVVSADRSEDGTAESSAESGEF